MTFFRRASLLVFLINSCAIFCLTFLTGRVGGWQTVAHADNVRVSSERRGDKSRAYYNRGTAYYKKRNFDSAIKYLSMSLALKPKAAGAYFNRGLSYRRQHKIDEAISDFSNAIKLQSDQPDYYFERCNALIVKDDFGGAVSDCSEGIRLSPNEAEGYFMRGVAHMLRGDLDEALADSVQALRINPDYRNAKRLLFETLLKNEEVNRHTYSITSLIKNRNEKMLSNTIDRSKNLPKEVLGAEKT